MRAIKQFKTDQGRIFASTFTESAQGMLMNVWNGDFGGAQGIGSVMQYSFKQLCDKKLEYWLSDVSNLEGAVEQGSQEAIEQFNRMLGKCNLKKFTFVSRRSESEGRRQIEQVISKHGIEVKTFPTYIKAIQWLLVPGVDEKVWDDSPELEF